MHFPAVIISSRPEGVTDLNEQGKEEVGFNYKKEGFEVISLKALSDAKAVDAVKKQLTGDEYFENLLKIKDIRQKHDDLYAREVCTPRPSHRWHAPYRQHGPPPH